MAICCDEQKRLFTLETAHASYQMKVDAHSVLLHLYYGRKVECAGALDSLEYLLTCLDRGFSGNPYDAGADRTYSLDVLPQEYPTLGTGDYRNAALVVENADGTACCDLRYRTHRLERGKYALKGLPAVFADETEAETLVIELADPVSGVRAELFYGVLEREDIITRSVRITNPGTGVIKVRKAASACLDFPYGEFELLTFHGRHTMERNVERRGLSHGTISVGSRRGTSSHQYSPGVILAERGATEEFGDCYGMLFVYSGEFLCEAERDPFDQTRLLMGLQSDRFCYPLSCGESLTVPETILCYSGEGLGGLSRRYHACIRDHLCRGSYAKRVRPVLLNSWEAA